MPTYTKHEPGTFSWVDLATNDAASAKKFYGGLFGWSFDDMPSGPGMTYSMALLRTSGGDKRVCALYSMGKEMQGVPPNWTSYITVADVNATTKAAKTHGGTIIKDAFDVMDVGRMSLVQDPSGAIVALWQAKKHHGADVKKEPGTLTYNELMTTDVDAAGKFFAQTLGWNAKAVPMGPGETYTLFERAGETAEVGGMMAMPRDMKGVPSHWLAYFAVADCDASAKKAGQLGGKVLMPPKDIPHVGRFAVIEDPTGAVFALFKTAH